MRSASKAKAVITQGVERSDRQWSGGDRAEHGSEGARAGLEAGCRHHGANRGLALGRPHGSVAVRVLALDHHLLVILPISGRTSWSIIAGLPSSGVALASAAASSVALGGSCRSKRSPASSRL